MDEINDIGNVIANTIDNKGEDKRNFFGILRAQRGATDLYNISGDSLNLLNEAYKSNKIGADEYKEGLRNIIEASGNDLGLNVSLVYLDTSTMPKDSKGSVGAAYIDKETGRTLIPINTDKIGSISELLGTVFEEISHIRDGLAGRQDKKVADDKSNNEKGLESLGRPSNDYAKKKFEKNDSSINLTTDGIDLTNANVGEKVGDDIFDDQAFEESLKFTLRNGAEKLTNDSLKVIEEKGIEYASEKVLVKYESTIHKKFADEKAVKKEIEEKRKIAIQKPLYNYYLAVDGISRKVTIEKERKSNSLGKNLKNSTAEALKEGYNSVKNIIPNKAKWQKVAKEYGEMESTLDISALLVAGENLITVPGRMSTEINLFGAGEIQYGSEKEIKERQQELNEITRGKADLLTTIVAVESIKDSKAAQKLKNKFSPNEIPNLTIEDGASKVGKVKIG